MLDIFMYSIRVKMYFEELLLTAGQSLLTRVLAASVLSIQWGHAY